MCWRLVVSFGLDEVQLAKWQACRRGRAVKWIHDWEKNAMNCLSLMSLCNAVGAWNQPSTRLVFGSRTFSRNDYYLTSRVTFSLTLQTCVSLQGLPQNHFRSNCLSAGLEITRTYKKIMDCHNCLLREWGNGQPFSGGILCRFFLSNGEALKSLTEVCCNGFVLGLLGRSLRIYQIFCLCIVAANGFGVWAAFTVAKRIAEG